MIDVRAASLHPNVVAFKRAVREKESNQNDDGPDSAYTLVNGGKHFFSFVDHPYKGLSTYHGGKAAGVAQFLPSTWGDEQQKWGLKDFSPPNQEIAFTGRFIYRDALDDIIAGRFDQAVAKCRLEWTSLPGASESRSSWTLDKARDVYLKWGGQLADAALLTQPAAPIEDHTDATFTIGGADNSNSTQNNGDKPMPLVLSLLPMVLQLFSGRAQAQLQKVTGAAPDVVQQFAQSVIDKVQQVTGTNDPVQAVAALTKDPQPANVQAVEDHAMDYFDKLGPVLDKMAQIEMQVRASQVIAMDAAAKRAQGEKWDMTPWLVWMAGGCVSIGVVALLGTILFQATTGERKIDTALLTFAGPLITMAFLAWKEIFAYRFDGNKESATQTAALAAVAQSRG